MTAPLLFNNQRWEAGAHEEVSPWKIQVFGTIKVQLAEMTGFEVERGGRTGSQRVEWGPVWKKKKKKKSEPEDNCGPISPLGFCIINMDKEADYQVLTVYFVWIFFCLWRGSEALASLALWRLSCWWEDLSETPWCSHGTTEASQSSQRRRLCSGETSVQQTPPLKGGHTPLKWSFSFKKDVDLKRSKSNLIITI